MPSEVKICGAWYDDEHLYVRVDEGGERRATRRVAAPWSLFVRDPSRSLQSALSNTRGIRHVSIDGAGYLRADAVDRATRWLVAQNLADEVGRARVCEADADPFRRWMSDAHHVSISDDLRVMYLDLEAQEPGKSIVDATRGLVRVLSFAACRVANGVVGTRRHAGVLAAETDDAERAMLGELLDFMDAHADVVVAWYGGGDRHGDGFDFDCLRERCRVLGVRWPRPPASFCWFDQMAARVKINDADGADKSSNKLGDVGRAEFGDSGSKLDVPGHLVYEAYKRNPLDLLRYNMVDTDLCRRIEEKRGYVGMFMAVAKLCHLVPHTACLDAVKQGDGFLLRAASVECARGSEEAIRWPTRWGDASKDKKLAGAYVFPPEMGIIDHVCVLDFAAMYPSIAASGHMSPENHAAPDAPGAIRLPNRDGAFRGDRQGYVPRAVHAMLANRARYKAEMKQHVPGTPTHSKFKALDFGAKIVANSVCFGITGTPFSRFFDPQTFEGITTTGQYLIRMVDAATAEASLRVIGGDSDSIFAQKPAEMPFPEVDEFVARVNASIPSALEAFNWPREECIVQLEFDEAFHRMVVDGDAKTGEGTKKRYIGRYSLYKGREPDPRMLPKVRGYEFRRGDALPLIRRMQTELFQMLLGAPGAPVPSSEHVHSEAFVQDLAAWVERWRTAVLSDPISLDDVTLRRGLSKPVDDYFAAANYTTTKCSCGHRFGGMEPTGPSACPECSTPRTRVRPGAHVRIALQLQQRGELVLPGDRVAYVMVVSDDGKEDVPVLPEDADPDKISRAYVWRRCYTSIRKTLSACYPEYSWATVADAAMRRAQVSRTSSRPQTQLFAEPPVEVVVEIRSEEACDVLARALPRCRGSTRVVLLVEGTRMHFGDDAIPRVDVDLLRLSSPRIRKVADTHLVIE